MHASSMSLRIGAGLLLGTVLVQGQTYTNAFNLTFTRPLWMEEIPTKPEHFLVMEQVGTAQVVRKEGADWVKSQFLKVTVAGGTSGGDERGLLGLAFHPDYAVNKKYYIYYVTSSGGDAEIVEERLADATLLKDAGKSKEILRIQDPYGNHNGGTIRFGADGFLYIGTGDGGDQNDPNGNGQNKNALLAKMLRIDVDRQENGKNYGIPSDNPFAAGGGAKEIYAYGFRNPYKWAFDRVTKDLWVADVGQGAQEEVDIVQKGGNYGWDVSEGTNGVTGEIKGPVFSYGRGSGGSIIGGYVFRGNPASKFYGQFLCGDHLNPYNMWAVKSNGPEAKGVSTVLAKPPAEPRGWGTDNQGRLYLMAGTSTIYRLDGADWGAATVSLLPGSGYLKQSIGCIFSCRPGSHLDSRAFEGGRDLEILSLAGESQGMVARATGEIPAGIKAGVYILRPLGKAKPNLLMIK